MAKRFFQYVFFSVFTLLLTACEQATFPAFKNTAYALINDVRSNADTKSKRKEIDLGSLIEGSRPVVEVDEGFISVLTQAVAKDPAVLAAKNESSASKAKLLLTKTGKDTQINATVLGGVEDITDEKMGVAAIINADRILYDGGIIDAKIAADTFYVKSAEQVYLATRGQSALKLANAWIELELYTDLNELIKSRLAVLDPLLVQLESVATSGLGDVSQVASAQRIVSAILVNETAVLGKYNQARVAYVSGFGRLPSETKYDEYWMAKNLPNSSIQKLVENSPPILAKFWAYKAAEASVVAVKALDDFNIGFKLKIQRPFGGSQADSDESVGLALTKKFYRGDQLESQIKRAEANASVMAAQVTDGYRTLALKAQSARELIKTMKRSIKLAKSNSKSLREEIKYLRKQLIIGGSTLESVLTAEARLYEAESKEIEYIAERRKAEALLVAISGYLSKSLGPS